MISSTVGLICTSFWLEGGVRKWGENLERKMENEEAGFLTTEDNKLEK